MKKLLCAILAICTLTLCACEAFPDPYGKANIPQEEHAVSDGETSAVEQH